MHMHVTSPKTYFQYSGTQAVQTLKYNRKISFQKATPYVYCEYMFMFMCSHLCVLKHVPYNKTEDKDDKST